MNVFTRVAGVWSQQAYVKASNTQANDLFGYTVTLSADGNTMAVGAMTEDSSATGVNGNQADNSAIEGGAVYIFSRVAGAWSQQAYVKASNTEANDNFGRAVALSGDGDTLVVSATAEASNATGINGDQSNNLASFSGAAYVFVRSSGAWSQQAYIKASNAGVFDRFGNAVALSSDGNMLLIGAPDEASSATGINGNQADNAASASGAAYLFARSGSTWSQVAYVKASNTEFNDLFGSAVAVSPDGTTFLVSALGERSNAVGVGGDQTNNALSINAGAVYVFIRAGSAWSQQAYVKASNTRNDDAFGFALALSANGDTLAVGSLEDSGSTGVGANQSDNSAIDAGALYLY